MGVLGYPDQGPSTAVWRVLSGTGTGTRQGGWGNASSSSPQVLKAFFGHGLDFDQNLSRTRLRSGLSFLANLNRVLAGATTLGTAALPLLNVAVGIFQVMPVSETTERMIMEGANAMQLAEQSRQEGVDDLRASGLRKVKQGVTSLEEINRVTKD